MKKIYPTLVICAIAYRFAMDMVAGVSLRYALAAVFLFSAFLLLILNKDK